MTVKHITGSKKLLEILHGFGHVASHSTIQRLETDMLNGFLSEMCFNFNYRLLLVAIFDASFRYIKFSKEVVATTTEKNKRDKIWAQFEILPPWILQTQFQLENG